MAKRLSGSAKRRRKKLAHLLSGGEERDSRLRQHNFKKKHTAVAAELATVADDKGVQSLDTPASTESTPPHPKMDSDSGLRSFAPAPSSTSASTHPSDFVSDFGHGSFTPDLLTGLSLIHI